MAVSPKDIQILFTNYDIITYFLNLAFCSEHFIYKTSNIGNFWYKPKKLILSACIAFKRVMSLILVIFFCQDIFYKEYIKNIN